MKKLFMVGLILFGIQSHALNLELTQGINAALPIAVNSFGNDRMAQAFSQVITQDLTLSGQFKIISDPKGSYANATVKTLKWMGADSVVIGKVVPLGDDRFQVSFQLVDAAAQGKVLLNQRYEVNENEMRRLAHHVSDEIYENLTGDKGVFSTRIAYILVKNRGEEKTYSLEVADMDGYQSKSLITSTEPIMSPTWSANGKEIAFVSFEKRRAQIYTVSVKTGQRKLITSFEGINGAPAWSPDGKEMAVVLSKSGFPKIYRIQLSTGHLKQVTFGHAIDTEPSYSPDGKSLLFTSGRGGTPQIYELNLQTNRVKRMTFDGNYNARSSYTPDQSSLVMLHREETNFNIGVLDLQSGKTQRLTDSRLDESPSIAPNGRLILFATRTNGRGMLGIVSIDGRIKLRLPSREGDVQEPAWSPYTA